MTATGSHIDFGFAARSTTLQGKAFLCPVGLSVDFHYSVIASWRIEACLAPTLKIGLPTTPHPAALRPLSSDMTATGSHIDFGFAARSTTLQGKAFLTHQKSS